MEDSGKVIVVDAIEIVVADGVEVGSLGRDCDCDRDCDWGSGPGSFDNCACVFMDEDPLLYMLAPFDSLIIGI